MGVRGLAFIVYVFVIGWAGLRHSRTCLAPEAAWAAQSLPIVPNAHHAETCKSCTGHWSEVWQKGRRHGSRPASRSRPSNKEKRGKGKEKEGKDQAPVMHPEAAVFPGHPPWIPTTPHTRAAGSMENVLEEPGGKHPLPPPPILPTPPNPMPSTSSVLTAEEVKLMAHLQAIKELGMLPSELADQLASLETRQQEGNSAKALTHAHLNRLNKVRNQTAALTDKIKKLDQEWIDFVQEAQTRLANHAEWFSQHRANLMQSLAQKHQELASLKMEVNTASQSLVATLPTSVDSLAAPNVAEAMQNFSHQADLMVASMQTPVEIHSDSELMGDEDMETRGKEVRSSVPSRTFRLAGSPGKVAQNQLKPKAEHKKDKKDTKEAKEVKEIKEEEGLLPPTMADFACTWECEFSQCHAQHEDACVPVGPRVCAPPHSMCESAVDEVVSFRRPALKGARGWDLKVSPKFHPVVTMICFDSATTCGAHVPLDDIHDWCRDLWHLNGQIVPHHTLINLVHTWPRSFVIPSGFGQASLGTSVDVSTCGICAPRRPRSHYQNVIDSIEVQDDLDWNGLVAELAQHSGTRRYAEVWYLDVGTAHVCIRSRRVVLEEDMDRQGLWWRCLWLWIDHLTPARATSLFQVRPDPALTRATVVHFLLVQGALDVHTPVLLSCDEWTAFSRGQYRAVLARANMPVFDLFVQAQHGAICLHDGSVCYVELARAPHLRFMAQQVPLLQPGDLVHGDVLQDDATDLAVEESESDTDDDGATTAPASSVDIPELVVSEEDDDGLVLFQGQAEGVALDRHPTIDALPPLACDDRLFWGEIPMCYKLHDLFCSTSPTWKPDSDEVALLAHQPRPYPPPPMAEYDLPDGVPQPEQPFPPVQEDDPMVDDQALEGSESEPALPPESSVDTAQERSWRSVQVCGVAQPPINLRVRWDEYEALIRDISSQLGISWRSLITVFEVYHVPEDLATTDVIPLIIRRSQDLIPGDTLRMILVDVHFHAPWPAGTYEVVRCVKVVPPSLTRATLLEVLGLAPFCRLVKDRCLMWVNHVLIALQHLGHLHFAHADYVKIAIPPWKDSPQQRCAIPTRALAAMALDRISPRTFVSRWQRTNPADWLDRMPIRRSRLTDHVFVPDDEVEVDVFSGFQADCSRPRLQELKWDDPLVLPVGRHIPSGSDTSEVSSLMQTQRGGRSRHEIPQDEVIEVETLPFSMDVQRLAESWTNGFVVDSPAEAPVALFTTWFISPALHPFCIDPRPVYLGADMCTWEDSLLDAWLDVVDTRNSYRLHVVANDRIRTIWPHGAGHVVIVQSCDPALLPVFLVEHCAAVPSPLYYMAACFCRGMVNLAEVQPVLTALARLRHRPETRAISIQHADHVVDSQTAVLPYPQPEQDAVHVHSVLEDTEAIDIEHSSFMQVSSSSCQVAVASPSGSMNASHSDSDSGTFHQCPNCPDCFDARTWYVHHDSHRLCLHSRDFRLCHQSRNWASVFSEVWPDRFVPSEPFRVLLIHPPPFVLGLPERVAAPVQILIEQGLSSSRSAVLLGQEIDPTWNSRHVAVSVPQPCAYADVLALVGLHEIVPDASQIIIQTNVVLHRHSFLAASGTYLQMVRRPIPELGDGASLMQVTAAMDGVVQACAHVEHTPIELSHVAPGRTPIQVSLCDALDLPSSSSFDEHSIWHPGFGLAASPVLPPLEAFEPPLGSLQALAHWSSDLEQVDAGDDDQHLRFLTYFLRDTLIVRCDRPRVVHVARSQSPAHWDQNFRRVWRDMVQPGSSLSYWPVTPPPPRNRADQLEHVLIVTQNMPADFVPLLFSTRVWPGGWEHFAVTAAAVLNYFAAVLISGNAPLCFRLTLNNVCRVTCFGHDWAQADVFHPPPGASIVVDIAEAAASAALDAIQESVHTLALTEHAATVLADVHRALQYTHRGGHVPIHAWFIHHDRHPTCRASRLLTLTSGSQDWPAQICSLWADVCDPALSIDAVVAHVPPDRGWTQPRTVHVLFHQACSNPALQNPIFLVVSRSGLPRPRATSLPSVMSCDEALMLGTRLAEEEGCDVPNQVWLDQEPVYDSPSLTVLAGHELALVFEDGLESHEPADGVSLVQRHTTVLPVLAPSPPPAQFAQVAQDTWHILDERLDEQCGTALEVTTWFVAHHRAPACDRPRSVQLRRSDPDWRALLSDAWSDAIDSQGPVAVAVVDRIHHCPGPRQVHVILWQEPVPGRVAALAVTCPEPFDPVHVHMRALSVPESAHTRELLALAVYDRNHFDIQCLWYLFGRFRHSHYMALYDGACWTMTIAPKPPLREDVSLLQISIGTGDELLRPVVNASVVVGDVVSSAVDPVQILPQWDACRSVECACSEKVSDVQVTDAPMVRVPPMQAIPAAPELVPEADVATVPHSLPVKPIEIPGLQSLQSFFFETPFQLADGIPCRHLYDRLGTSHSALEFASMSRQVDHLEIYTDGSCRWAANVMQEVATWAFVVVAWTNGHPSVLGCASGLADVTCFSSSRLDAFEGEAQAAYQALAWLCQAADVHIGVPITLVMDAFSALQGASGQWTVQHREVLRDLVRPLFAAVCEMAPCSARWQKSHAGNPFNDLADHLATVACAEVCIGDTRSFPPATCASALPWLWLALRHHLRGGSGPVFDEDRVLFPCPPPIFDRDVHLWPAAGEARSASLTLDLQLLTYNVTSLQPRRSRLKRARQANVALLQQQCRQQHVVMLQETRVRTTGAHSDGTWLMYTSAASSGQGGCEIWLNCLHPFACLHRDGQNQEVHWNDKWVTARLTFEARGIRRTLSQRIRRDEAVFIDQCVRDQARDFQLASGTALWKTLKYHLPRWKKRRERPLRYSATQEAFTAHFAGIEEAQIMTLDEVHTPDLRADERVIFSKRGTRPGDPTADLMFTALMGRILALTAHDIGHCYPVVDLDGSSFRIDPITWVDDVAVYLEDPDPMKLLQKIGEVSGAFYSRCREVGLDLNFRAGKSETIVRLEGRGSQRAHKHLQLHWKEGIPLQGVDQTIRLQATTAYVHLGQKQTAAMNHDLEIDRRAALAAEALRDCAPLLKHKFADAMSRVWQSTSPAAPSSMGQTFVCRECHKHFASKKACAVHEQTAHAISAPIRAYMSHGTVCKSCLCDYHTTQKLRQHLQYAPNGCGDRLRQVMWPLTSSEIAAVVTVRQKGAAYRAPPIRRPGPLLPSRAQWEFRCPAKQFPTEHLASQDRAEPSPCAVDCDVWDWLRNMVPWDALDTLQWPDPVWQTSSLHRQFIDQYLDLAEVWLPEVTGQQLQQFRDRLLDSGGTRTLSSTSVVSLQRLCVVIVSSQQDASSSWATAASHLRLVYNTEIDIVILSEDSLYDLVDKTVAHRLQHLAAGRRILGLVAAPDFDARPSLWPTIERVLTMQSSFTPSSHLVQAMQALTRAHGVLRFGSMRDIPRVFCLPRAPPGFQFTLDGWFGRNGGVQSMAWTRSVQLLKPAGKFAEELQGVVQPWPLPGRFKSIRCEGNWQKWYVKETKDGLGGVDRTARVQGRKASSWAVSWSRAEANVGQLRYRPELAEGASEVTTRNFDAVVLAFEANKILQGCKSGYKMVPPSVTPTLRGKLSGKTKTSQIWNLMVAFDRELPMPWDAASIDGHGSLAWVAVNSSKPQRQRVPQCFMVFSTYQWAAWKQWSKKEVERVLLYDFMAFLADVLGSWPPEPSFVLSGRWGNNTEATSRRSCKRAASPLWDGEDRMGATGSAGRGDWARGFSVSDAYSAGQELAERMLEDLSEKLKGGCSASLRRELVSFPGWLVCLPTVVCSWSW
eukprot:Skav227436  [mRNA]  locus=scaffold203:245111:270429:+ [translate_table: standard]